MKMVIRKSSSRLVAPEVQVDTVGTRMPPDDGVCSPRGLVTMVIALECPNYVFYDASRLK